MFIEETLASNQPNPAQADSSRGPEVPQLPDDRLKREIFQRTLMLATAAHELKTPLAIISGYADFLLGTHAGPITEMQKMVLTEMQQSTSRLQRLVQTFLSFSALESGRFDVRKELGNVNQNVSEVIAQWAVPYAARQTACEFMPDEKLGPIRFDHLKLQNILNNLLDNALKFTPPGGHVTIQTQCSAWERRSFGHGAYQAQNRRMNDAQSKHDGVRISVTDNGPGISPQYYHEIFEEFRQIHNQSHGIGLGLAIARRLTEAHGGRIWVESIVGQGSTFSVWLPK
jgi:signal transduction histidine kinase